MQLRDALPATDDHLWHCIPSSGAAGLAVPPGSVLAQLRAFCFKTSGFLFWKMATSSANNFRTGILFIAIAGASDVML